MKVAVVGGTGVLGAPLVAALAARGNEVLALSRTAPKALPDGAAHRAVDLTSGQGLAEALAGAEAAVDCSNAPPKAGPAQAVLVEGTRRLLQAEAEAGVHHHVGISIVGCDRVPIPYYRAKAAQEEAIAVGTIPWSLLRASQFHQLLAYMFERCGRLRVLPTGKARLQPIDPTLVATRLAEAVHAGPGGRLPEIAGPRVQTLGELAAAWRQARGKGALPLRVPMIGPVGKPVREGALCNPAAAAGGPTFEQWLGHEGKGGDG